MCRELRELDVGWDIRVLHDAPDALTFLRDYVSCSKPVLIRGHAAAWPAVEHWNKEFLVQRLSGKEVTVAVTPNGRADAVTPLRDVSGACRQCFALPHEESMSFTLFMHNVTKQVQQQELSNPAQQERPDQLKGSTQQSDLIVYLQQQNSNLTEHFPELLKDVEPSIPWAAEALGMQPEAVNLWIGSSASLSSFHKDHYENLYTVVVGQKTFTLLPPAEGLCRLQLQPFPVAQWRPDTSGKLHLETMEPLQHVQWSPVVHGPEPSVLDTDGLPAPLTVTLEAGDTLYLPSMWWHQVEQHAGPEGFVAAVNQWFDMKFDCKVAYYQLAEALCKGQEHEMH
eukprot:jgi/Astpho2/3337/Aster-04685